MKMGTERTNVEFRMYRYEGRDYEITRQEFDDLRNGYRTPKEMFG